MPRNLEGEFELVLGNKQLLSLFFLVVVLFAVFFSLGYMVGKSVAPSPAVASQQAVSGGGPASAAEISPSPAGRGASGGSAPAEAPPPPVTETQPARSEAVPAVASAPVAADDIARPKVLEAGPADSGALVAREMHLQIAAVRVRGDAEALVESLRKKGYAVVLHSQTHDGWYRVLVGPFASEGAAREMKALLEKDGYKSILKKP